ncbi:MAG: CDP-alcohol phosphatidyltransferase family protein [Candidatus Kapaibacterium sp.]
MEADQTGPPPLNLRWTLSNIISALRIVLAIPTAFVLVAGMRWTAVALCLAASLTDVLDGYIARRYNEISDLGKILDPLADKAFVGMLVVVLLIQHQLPFWLVAVVLGRDLLILLGGLAVERRTGVVLPSNYPGKAAVVALSLMLVLVIIGADPMAIDILMAIALILLAISLYLYGKRAFGALRGGTA